MVLSHTQDQGPAVVRAVQQRRQQDKGLERLRDMTHRRLRLRRLTLDPLLQPRQAAACLQRLLHHHAVLSNSTDGLSLRISNTNRVSADGSQADIAWNFKL